ncbi:hypothetical protein, partial [Anaeromyxobacter oryzisoli]|uniref:hypothetical protein n=1 Tax=Anaeromyxobacter oryzisoli TaxID=2925408 RepID=UPI0038CBF423
MDGPVARELREVRRREGRQELHGDGGLDEGVLRDRERHRGPRPPAPRLEEAPQRPRPDRPPRREPDHEVLGEPRVPEQLAHDRRLALRGEAREQVRIALRPRRRLLVTEREMGEARVGPVARRLVGPRRWRRGEHAGDLEEPALRRQGVELGAPGVRQLGIGARQGRRGRGPRRALGPATASGERGEPVRR